MSCKVLILKTMISEVEERDGECLRIQKAMESFCLQRISQGDSPVACSNLLGPGASDLVSGGLWPFMSWLQPEITSLPVFARGLIENRTILAAFDEM